MWRERLNGPMLASSPIRFECVPLSWAVEMGRGELTSSALVFWNWNAGIAISLYYLWDWVYLYYHTNIAGA